MNIRALLLPAACLITLSTAASADQCGAQRAAVSVAESMVQYACTDGSQMNCYDAMAHLDDRREDLRDCERKVSGNAL